MARRGRPKGGDSAETRKRIIDAAREEFSLCGYDGASVATIAAKSELAPSAVYHYFGGKAALYEEVFETTNAVMWDLLLNAATQNDTLLESVQTMISSTTSMDPKVRRYGDFLALIPMEATLHPEFAYMLELRIKWQDGLFGTLAELGVKTGELDGFDVDAATEMLRSLLMGWFVESHYRDNSGQRSGKAVINLIRLLGERSDA